MNFSRDNNRRYYGRSNNNNRRSYNHQKDSSHNSNGQKTFAASNDKSLQPLLPDTFRVLPLGGQGEIGRYSTAYEYNENIIIIDSGIGYAPHGLKGGVDYLLPNNAYFSHDNNQKKVQALFLTSPTLEYSGNAINLIKQLDIKNLYTSPYFVDSNKIILEQLKKDGLNIHILESSKPVEINNCFTVTPVQTAFNSIEAFNFLIESTAGNVFHSGAFKLDYQLPISQFSSDLVNLVDIVNNKTINLMLSPSLNVENKNYSTSEHAVAEKLIHLFKNSLGRVCCLVPHNYNQRVVSILQSALEAGRKVFVDDHQLKQSIDIMQSLGYLDNVISAKQLKDLCIDETKFSKIDKNKLVIIKTESEARILDPLFALADKADLLIKLESADTIALCAEHPLGTTRLLARAIDKLFEQGIQVIGGMRAGLHAPAYAGQEELKFLYNIARPKYFLPIIGEVRHIITHGELLADCGLDTNSILIADNGNAIEISKETQEIQLGGKVNCSPIFMNQQAGQALNNSALEDRQKLAKDGMIIISLIIDSNTLTLNSQPYIQTIGNGFEGSAEWDALSEILITDITKVIKKALQSGHKEISLLKRLVHEIFNKKSREKIGMFQPMMSVVIQDIY